MKSNPDSAALAQQVQALAATIEELTKQNQEMKLRLQQVQQVQQEGNGLRVTWMKKEIAIGEVLIKDLLPQTSRIQIYFGR